MKKSKSVGLRATKTIEKVYGTMKKNSSRVTGKVSLSRLEIAQKLDIGPRTVDNAICALKRNKTILKDGHRYIINLKKK